MRFTRRTHLGKGLTPSPLGQRFFGDGEDLSAGDPGGVDGSGGDAQMGEQLHGAAPYLALAGRHSSPFVSLSSSASSTRIALGRWLPRRHPTDAGGRLNAIVPQVHGIGSPEEEIHRNREHARQLHQVGCRRALARPGLEVADHAGREAGFLGQVLLRPAAELLGLAMPLAED